MPLALVGLHEALNLFAVWGFLAIGAFLWNRRRHRNALEQAARKERVAEFNRRLIRAERAREEALRCKGGVVR